jgi:hypothetical protein
MRVRLRKDNAAAVCGRSGQTGHDGHDGHNGHDGHAGRPGDAEGVQTSFPSQRETATTQQMHGLKSIGVEQMKQGRISGAMARMGRWTGERMQTTRLMKQHDHIDRSTSGKGRSTPAGKGRAGQGRAGKGEPA